MLMTVKLEGVSDLKKFLDKKGDKVISEGEKVIRKHMHIILQSARVKIRNRSFETARSLKVKIDGKGKTFVVAKIGTLGGTKNDAVRANSLEYGHAVANEGRDRLGKRLWIEKKKLRFVRPYPYLRPAIEEDRLSFKSDMTNAIKKIAESTT